MKCSTCQKKLDNGTNLFKVEEGVAGTAGFVDLEEPAYFCNEECLKEYFSASKGYDRWKVKKRVP